MDEGALDAPRNTHGWAILRFLSVPLSPLSPSLSPFPDIPLPCLSSLSSFSLHPASSISPHCILYTLNSFSIISLPIVYGITTHYLVPYLPTLIRYILRWLHHNFRSTFRSHWRNFFFQFSLVFSSYSSLESLHETFPPYFQVSPFIPIYTETHAYIYI